jgi:hypothetical protein
MPSLNDEHPRALRLLARSRNGCTEALMMAHGFETALLGRMIVEGLAMATPHVTRAGSRPMVVAR